MGSDDDHSERDPDIASDTEGKISRQHSATEDDEELNIQLGPKVSLKEHLEKDKVRYHSLHMLVWIINKSM